MKKYGCLLWLSLISMPAFSADASTPLASMKGTTDNLSCEHTSWASILIVGLTYVLTLLAFAVIAGALRRSTTWSLADALSEEATVTKQTGSHVPAANVAAGDAPGMGAGAAGAVQPPELPQPEMVTVLAGSTSRLVAFLGLVVILIMFLAFGSLIMLRLSGCNASDPSLSTDIDSLVKYLLGGAALFVPYGFNQIKAAVSSIFPK